MSSGFHYLGANAGKVPGFSNRLPGMSTALLAPLPSTPAKVIPALDPVHVETELKPMQVQNRSMAQQQGYTGDQCSNCNSMRMKISGHCMVCEDCGTTTGCS